MKKGHPFEGAKQLRRSGTVEAALSAAEDDYLQVKLRGDLPAMPTCASSKKKPRLKVETGSYSWLVAGVGFEPTTFRL